MSMREGMWSARVIRKYVLLQLPGMAGFVIFLIILQRWVDFPWWLFWVAVAALAFKDALFYPFVWRAYAAPEPPFQGETGIATERLDPSGYIRIRGELWRALLSEANTPVEKGRPVRVLRVEGLTLVVRPVDAPPTSTVNFLLVP